MLETLYLGIGTLILVCVNIALGSISALMNREWNWTTFWNGIIKGSIVTAAFAAVWFVGWLNKDSITVEVDGQMVNLQMAVHLILAAGFAVYAKKVVVKLKELITKKAEEYKNLTPKNESDSTKTEDSNNTSEIGI